VLNDIAHMAKIILIIFLLGLVSAATN